MLSYLTAGVVIGIAAGAASVLFWKRLTTTDTRSFVQQLLHWHLGTVSADQLAITERRFPLRVRVDVQRALERFLGESVRVVQFHGIKEEYGHKTLGIADCLALRQRDDIHCTAAEYEDVDIGEAEPVRVLKTGLWLLDEQGIPSVVLLTPVTSYHGASGVSIQVAASGGESRGTFSERLFRVLEEAVAKGATYRGKILSLEQAEHDYSGQSRGITVHKLRPVDRDQVILPAATLDLLDRNVIRFVEQRSRLSRLGQSTRKGILFYGPPGTGKTHTIHYLARCLPGHTTLIISAEQVGLLGEYMTLARLLQPSMVVIEDVDLIARDREEMGSACEEVLLNKLLNEMDGLNESADILFVLTTNRPKALEAALASRPGRIDQAIEFPPPDEVGREKLVRLYAPRAPFPDEVVAAVVRRTEGVSGAFLKEVTRRICQCYLERGGEGEIAEIDVDRALEEMLFSGGGLNRSLLGAGTIAKS